LNGWKKGGDPAAFRRNLSSVPRAEARLRSCELDRNTALAEIGLHELSPGAIVLHQFGRIKYGFLGTRALQGGFQRCDMQVQIKIIGPKRFIDPVCRFRYG